MQPLIEALCKEFAQIASFYGLTVSLPKTKGGEGGASPVKAWLREVSWKWCKILLI